MFSLSEGKKEDRQMRETSDWLNHYFMRKF